MSHNLSIRVLGLALALLASLLAFTACRPDLSERDFFLSQKRDPRLIGVWSLIYDRMEEDSQTREYTLRGEIKVMHNRVPSALKYYFYTKDGILYQLLLGDGFKRSNWTHEYEYYFSEDGTVLYTKPKGSSDDTISRWKRIEE